jgi:hypothetical protein
VLDRLLQVRVEDYDGRSGWRRCLNVELSKEERAGEKKREERMMGFEPTTFCMASL